VSTVSELSDTELISKIKQALHYVLNTNRDELKNLATGKQFNRASEMNAVVEIINAGTERNEDISQSFTKLDDCRKEIDQALECLARNKS